MACRVPPRCFNVQAGSFTEYRCKAFHPVSPSNKPASGNDTGAAMAAEDASGGGAADEVDHRPWTRAGATLCKHQDSFYLFGGSVVRDGGRKSMELYVLSTDTMAWRRQATTGDGRPAARSDHCAVIDPETERLIVFGGRSAVRPITTHDCRLDPISFGLHARCRADLMLP